MANQSSNRSKPTIAHLYEQDYYLWLIKTAKLLKEGKIAEVDLPNLVEEIEDMGRSEKRAIESNLEIVLMHLLKYKYQPEKRSSSWQYTLFEHRKRLRKAFKESPSLKKYCEQVFEESYQDAKKMAAIETGLDINIFPAECPFTSQDTLDEEYLPDDNNI
jgi:hypothetical protein